PGDARLPSVVHRVRFRQRCRLVQSSGAHRASLLVHLFEAEPAGGSIMNDEVQRQSPRSWINTVVAVAILAVMLFPFYWMINGSLQPNGNTLQGSWWPAHPDLAGYWSALQQQGANLLTSIVVAVGSAAVSLLIATPAAYALAHFRLPGVK